MAAFVASQRDAHGVPQAVSCRPLGVSQSWSCKWKAGELPPRAARRERLKAEVARLFKQRDGKDGSPRITAALGDAGWKVSENTVAVLMREQGLAARRKNKGSRRIVGFALGAHHDAALAYGALAMALAVRGGAVPGVVFHTDQGSEYTAGSFRAACERLGIAQSMGRPGSAPATAGSGSWHSTLEFEFRSLQKFTTRAAARVAAAAWIEDYNHVRRHSALGMRSPVDYERALAGKDAA